MKNSIIIILIGLVIALLIGLAVALIDDNDSDDDFTPASIVSGVDCGGQMTKDSVRLVPVGCIVSGDVSTSTSENGPWHFEGKSIADKGTIIIVQKDPTWVKAPYGAYASTKSISQVELEMGENGCVSGCKTFTKVYK